MVGYRSQPGCSQEIVTLHCQLWVTANHRMQRHGNDQDHGTCCLFLVNGRTRSGGTAHGALWEYVLVSHQKWNVMPSYSLHRLAVTQDSNRSVEDGVDDDHPTDPSMHPRYRRPINAEKMRRKPKGPPRPQRNEINNREVGGASVRGSPGSSPQDQWQDVHRKQKCDH